MLFSLFRCENPNLIKIRMIINNTTSMTFHRFSTSDGFDVCCVDLPAWISVIALLFLFYCSSSS